MSVCVCVSALTPLGGGLVHDSMETLSEMVSVREGESWEEGKSKGRGKKSREGETGNMRHS